MLNKRRLTFFTIILSLLMVKVIAAEQAAPTCDDVKKALVYQEREEAYFSANKNDQLGDLRNNFNKLKLKHQIFQGLKEIVNDYNSYLVELKKYDESSKKSIAKLKEITDQGLKAAAKYTTIEKFIEELMNNVTVAKNNPKDVDHATLIKQFDAKLNARCTQDVSQADSKLCQILRLDASNGSKFDREIAIVGFYNSYINSAKTQEEREADLKSYLNTLYNAPKIGDDYESVILTNKFHNHLNSILKSHKKCMADFNQLDTCLNKESKEQINQSFQEYKNTMHKKMVFRLPDGKGGIKEVSSNNKTDFNKAYDQIHTSFISSRFGDFQDMANNILNKREDLTKQIQANYLIAQDRASMQEDAGFLSITSPPPLKRIYKEALHLLDKCRDLEVENLNSPELIQCIQQYKDSPAINNQVNNLNEEMNQIQKKIEEILKHPKFKKIQAIKNKLYQQIKTACSDEVKKQKLATVKPCLDRTKCDYGVDPDVTQFIEIGDKIIAALPAEVDDKEMDELYLKVEEERKIAKEEAEYKYPKRGMHPAITTKGKKTIRELHKDYYVLHNPDGPPILSPKKPWLSRFASALPETNLLKDPKYMSLFASESSGLNAGHIRRQEQFAKLAIQREHEWEQLYKIQAMLNWQPGGYYYNGQYYTSNPYGYSTFNYGSNILSTRV